MVPFFPLVPDCAEFFALISLFCVYVMDLPGVLAACADILESSSLPLPSVAASAAIIGVRARFCVVGVAAVERRWRRRSKSDGAYETTKTKGTRGSIRYCCYQKNIVVAEHTIKRHVRWRVQRGLQREGGARPA